MERDPLLSPDGLPGPNGLQDHPAFLRACHSPWPWLPQNVLVVLRGILLAFIIATGIMILDYRLNEPLNFSNWRLIFDLAIISYFLFFLYHLITFSWTFTHLYYPRIEELDDGFESWVLELMSLPQQISSLRKQFYFTLFYTVTVIFAFSNSYIYWFITRQQDTNDDDDDGGPPSNNTIILSNGIKLMLDPRQPFSDLLGEGWFELYVTLAQFAIPSAIMVFETIWLNSIKRPIWLLSHVLGLIFFAGLYLLWAEWGIYLTGWYPFFWLDKELVGSTEAVVAYSIGFLLLGPIMYVLLLGLIAVRDSFTRTRAEARACIAAQPPLEED